MCITLVVPLWLPQIKRELEVANEDLEQVLALAITSFHSTHESSNIVHFRSIC